MFQEFLFGSQFWRLGWLIQLQSRLRPLISASDHTNNQMAKKSGKSKASAAAVEPRGKKIVFDAEPSIDGDASENEQQSVAGDEDEQDEEEESASEQGDQTDSDDDEAPEAVGFAVDQRKAQAEAEAEEAYVPRTLRLFSYTKV